MNYEEKIEQRAGRSTGYTVPDGFFEETFRAISSSLPEREIKAPARLSTWMRLRPYIYMAAMFAGIWCMMKMFHNMTSEPMVSLDNPPVLVSEAIDNSPEFQEMYTSVESSSDYQLESEVTSSYESFSQFEQDFGYELDDEYEEIDIAVSTPNQTE